MSFRACPPSAATAGSVRPFRSLSAKATAGKSLAQTTDRRVAHVIGASDLGKHFSRFPASKGFSSLMAGQLWLDGSAAGHLGKTVMAPTLDVECDGGN